MSFQVLAAPSILSSSFLHLEDDIKRIHSAGAQWIHLDVMDGQFVPKISFGSDIVASVASISNATIDVHLMMQNPEASLPFFINAGAQYITVHAEACTHLHRCVVNIKKKNSAVGVALLPSTTVSILKPMLHLLNLVLVMTVDPGYGGQEFLPFCLEKVQLLHDIREKKEYNYRIAVDGGINIDTAKLAREAGADILVSGSQFFKHENPRQYINALEGRA